MRRISNWLVAPLVSHEVPTTVRVLQGQVVAEILRQADELPAPVIVMSTHGRGGFERLVLGSVTEKIVRKARCPVLAVPAATDLPSGDRLRRIVCAVDFSEASASALSWAELLAGPAAANLLLLHVFEWPFGETTGDDPISTLRRSLAAEAQDQLDNLASVAQSRIAERVVRQGKPSKEIVEFAAERSADLVVLGASGRGAINQAVLGSTAHAVLRHMVCPVLTVPGPA